MSDVTMPLDLRAHPPGYAAIAECLRVQSGARPQTRWARFLGRDPLDPEARSWFVGALGEIATAQALDRLGPEWTVLHAVPIGQGDTDVDHVVVGPAGMFTINTKHHPGKRIWAGGHDIRVENFRTEYARKSKAEAVRASRLMTRAMRFDVPVDPVLVVVGARSVKFGQKAPAVPVVDVQAIVPWLRSAPQVLSPGAVFRLSEVASSRSTWHDKAVVLDDTLRHGQRFERLQRDIAQAASRARSMRRIRGWLLVGAVVAAGLLSLQSVAAALF